ncbi:MAG: FGGY-family carbohydrate kinase [Thermotogaceae bacterium]|nr:FGGY-family carbohydrate kinase [Thermotogaceae bacterium]
MGYFIGMDIGTQSTKAVVVDEKGKLIAQSSKSYSVNTPRPGWAQIDGEAFLKASFEVLKNLMDNLDNNVRKNIVAIAISGLYGGSGIPVDKDINPIYPCLIWMDRRAIEETEWVKNNIPEEKLLSITGNYVDSYFGFTKLLWIKNKEPEVWKKAYLFITPKDYVIYHLTGKIVIDHSSAGNLGGLYDLKNRRWSDEMSKLLDISLEKLPKDIVYSTEVVGTIKDDVAEELNLPKGIKVIAGGIDAPVAQLSAGSVDHGDQVVMLGTSMCWGFLHDGAKVTKSLVSFPYVINGENTVYTFGGGATSGAVISWFISNLMEGKENIYEKLEKGAKNVPEGSEGLILLPYFMGERSPIWDPFAKGVLFGLNLKHSRYHIYRAFMEGVAYSLRHNMGEAEKAKISLPETIAIVGGGANSDLWVQIMADVTGHKFVRIKGNVEAPLGDAFLACYGTKECEDAKDIKKWTTLGKEFIPRKFVVYEKLYSIYKKIYERTKDLMKGLIE